MVLSHCGQRSTVRNARKSYWFVANLSGPKCITYTSNITLLPWKRIAVLRHKYWLLHYERRLWLRPTLLQFSQRLLPLRQDQRRLPGCWRIYQLYRRKSLKRSRLTCTSPVTSPSTSRLWNGESNSAIISIFSSIIAISPLRTRQPSLSPLCGSLTSSSLWPSLPTTSSAPASQSYPRRWDSPRT